MVLGIIGLGLMGGSLSLSLKHKRVFTKHIGYVRNPVHREEAAELGLVDELVDLDTIIKESDVLVLAIPVIGIKELLPKLVDIKQSAVVIDLGSTKDEIVKAIPEKIKRNFVPAHPMCGTEYSGPAAAFRDLYRDRVCVLCNTNECSPESLDLAEKIFLMMDMKLHHMDAKEHDRHAAFISHLPHIISYSLANTVIKQEDKENILTLAAGGFEDMSRLAKSSPGMWKDIFRQNREKVLDSISLFRDELDKAEALLEKEQHNQLTEWMSEANTLHDIFKPKKRD